MGQTPETTIDSTTDVVINPDTANWDKRYHQAQQSKCLTPNLASTAVVRYENAAVCFAEVVDKSFNASFLLVEKKGKYQSVQSLKQGRVHFNNLPLDKDFQLIGKNSCGQEVVIAELNTNESAKGVATVADSLIFD